MRRKILAGLLLVGLQCFLIGGATAAYFTDNASLDAGAFEFTTLGISVEQTTPDSLQNNLTINVTTPDSAAATATAGWAIKNTGNQAVRLRVNVENGSPPNMLLIPDAKWEESGGYYYYKDSVDPEQSAFFHLTLVPAGDWFGSSDYLLSIRAQAMQVPHTTRGDWSNLP